MAYETELLPPGTSLLWNPKTQHLRCIRQGDGALFIRNKAENGPQYLTDRREAALACTVIGLTEDRAGEYLGVSPSTVHNQLHELYSKLGIQTPERLNAGRHHNHALHAFSRLAEAGLVESANRQNSRTANPIRRLDTPMAICKG